VRKKKYKKVRSIEAGLNLFEAGLKIAGICIPLVAVAGIGVGLFNKKYAQKNFDYFAKRLENIEIQMKNLTEDQERNFVFRVAEITNKTIKERNYDKIDIFANLIKIGITKSTVFQEDERIDKIIDVIGRLSLEDIEFMEQFYKNSCVQKTETPIFRSCSKGDFDDLQVFGNADAESVNSSGYKKGGMLILQKCVSIGLVVQELKQEKELIGEGLYLHKNRPLEQYKYEIQYTISGFYHELREYIQNSN